MYFKFTLLGYYLLSFMKRQIVLNSILIVSVFIISFYGRSIVDSLMTITYSSSSLKVLHSYSWWVLPSTLLVGLLYGFKNILKNLGLNKGLIIALIFSIITVLPMLISSAIVGSVDRNIDYGALLYKTLFAGFFEEYFFRGFLFGILFRKLKWGFIPASILGAIVFGLGHIYQGSSLNETIGVFAITAMGAVWFAWLYIEWGNNLWIPIMLHILMNLSWVLFEVSENALGEVYTNIFRAITIALTIIITIRYHKKRGLIITRRNLIVNSKG